MNTIVARQEPAEVVASASWSLYVEGELKGEFPTEAALEASLEIASARLHHQQIVVYDPKGDML